jgi:hypothetical protein
MASKQPEVPCPAHRRFRRVRDLVLTIERLGSTEQLLEFACIKADQVEIER